MRVMNHQDSPTQCPHCDGTGGIYYTVKQTYMQYFDWSGENRGPSEADGLNARTARCTDCKRPVTKWAKRIQPFNIYRFNRGMKTYDMGDSII